MEVTDDRHYVSKYRKVDEGFFEAGHISGCIFSSLLSFSSVIFLPNSAKVRAVCTFFSRQSLQCKKESKFYVCLTREESF